MQDADALKAASIFSRACSPFNTVSHHVKAILPKSPFLWHDAYEIYLFLKLITIM